MYIPPRGDRNKKYCCRRRLMQAYTHVLAPGAGSSATIA